jgi:putative NIF3 family GTP cyclohydrolase 1 type 2
MTAQEIFDLIRSLGTSAVDWSHTTDRITWGDPRKQVKRLGVAWMPSNENLEACIRWKADTLMTHEALFNWLHDTPPGPSDTRFFERKLQLLADSDLTIIRNHDVWDHVPDVGVHAVWVKQLGFDACPTLPLKAENDYEKMVLNYLELKKLKPITLKALAQHILDRVKHLGVSEIQYVGDSNAIVDSLLIQTGAFGIREQFNLAWKNHVGASIFTDELNYWSTVHWAMDVGLNCIFVPHVVSEADGIRSMADYFTKQLPDIEVKFLPQGSPHGSVSVR